MDHKCESCGKLYTTTLAEELVDEGMCPKCADREHKRELELSKQRCTCGAAQAGIVCFSC